jgi:hypothetical protein
VIRILLYLLDANVLIDANRDYYPFGMVPEFWDWLLYMGRRDNIKIPSEIFDELKAGKDDLSKWIKRKDVRKALQLEEHVQVKLVRKVINDGYAPDLDDIEVETIGRDPFLISYALADPTDRCVVTTEISKPSKTRANRRIPDVCKQLRLNTCHTFDLLRVLGFNTQWKKHP